MLIKHKGITHERMADAPFTGALICANNCTIGCKGCFNQYLKEEKAQENFVGDIIKIVKSNAFNDGIILAGLEWSLQSNQMMALTRAALAHGLSVMIYTGYNQKEFIRRVPEVLTLKGQVYIKYGAYDERKLVNDNIQYGVKLASSNQCLEKINTFENKWYQAIKNA